MKPTHINIIGKSKYIFNHDVYPQLREQRKFRDLILRIEPGGVLVLTKKVSTVDDIDPLIGYLVRRGIPRSDIRIKYPQMSAVELLNSKLSVGLAESGLGFGADVAEHDAGLARYFITT